MKKTNSAIRDICLRRIKKSTTKPIDFPFTKLFETELMIDVQTEFTSSFANIDKELPVAQTYIDKDNWTLATTRRVITSEDAVIKDIDPAKVTSYHYGNFKNIDNVHLDYYKSGTYTLGNLTADEGESINVYIETGRASMIMIQAMISLRGALRQYTVCEDN